MCKYLLLLSYFLFYNFEMCLIYVTYSGYRYTQTASKTTSSMTGCWNTARVDFSSDICWPIESRSIFVMGVLKKIKKKNKKNKKGWRKRKMSDGQNEIRHRSRRYFIVPDDQSGCEIPGLFAHRSHYKLKKLPPHGAIFSGNRWSCLLFISSFYSFFLFHVTLQWSFGSFSCESIKKF